MRRLGFRSGSESDSDAVSDSVVDSSSPCDFSSEIGLSEDDPHMGSVAYLYTSHAAPIKPLLVSAFASLL